MQPVTACVPGTPYCASAEVHGQGQVNGGAIPNVWPPVPTVVRPPEKRGRSGFGVVGVPVVRLGLSSGFKGGGAVAVSFRSESLTFEMETQLLYGGTTHAFDWTFPISFVVPLANDRSLFDGPYLRFGGSPIGATFAGHADGGGFVRFGVFAGMGWEKTFGAITWRMFDARLSLDMGTKRAMDRLDHWLDGGIQVGTGIVL